MLNILKWAILTLVASTTTAIDPDESRTFAQIIESRGYRLLEYTTTTADGYILLVHRVVTSEFNQSDSSFVRNYTASHKPAVFFHGIWTQSSIIFLTAPESLEAEAEADSFSGDSLGFGLLKAGYDLWVPNARGNGLSMDHLNLSNWSQAYWRFSYEQIGLYDIPAILKLVRGETRHQSVAWIGYSQGGQSLFALLSIAPHYARYIHPFIGLASTSYMGHAYSPAWSAFQLLRPAMMRLPGRFLLSTSWLNWLTQGLCRPEVTGSVLFCETTYTLLFGSSDNINQSRVPVFSRFVPKPVSRWQMAHILQNIRTGRYARFDYDDGHLFRYRNRAIYGTDEPPSWPIENIPKSFTAVMFYGATDSLCVAEDAARLVEELQELGVNITGIEVEDQMGNWNHIDFIMGTHAGRWVYDDVIEFLDGNVRMDWVGEEGEEGQ